MVPEDRQTRGSHPVDDQIAEQWAATRIREREARHAARSRRRRLAASITLVVLVSIVAVFVVRYLGARRSDTASAAATATAPAVARAVPPTTPVDSVTETSERPPMPGAGQAEAAAESTTADTASTTPDASAQAAPEDAAEGDPVAAAAVDFPGAPPIKPKVIFNAETKENVVAITLDDGMPVNEDILRLFEDRDIRATTFVLGRAVKANPKMMQRIHKAGFEIATHGWDHTSFTRMTESQMRSQLRRTQKEITKITGNQAPYFRPPYGAKNDRVVELVASEGYKVVMWDATLADTSPKASPDYCYRKALKYLHPGAIMLCHWHGKATYGALSQLLDELDRRGYRVVTVSELLAISKAEKERSQ